jgi:hypothetical protein
MKFSAIFWTLLSVTCGSFTTSTHASIVFENPLTSPASGYASNDPPSSGASQQMADDFTLTSATTIRAISWFGNYSDDEPEAGTITSFSLRVFADIGDGTSPVNGAPLLSEDVTAFAQVTGVSTTGDDREVFRYTANLVSPFALTSGTFWLSVVENDVTTNAETWEWQSTLSGSGATNMRRLPPSTPNWITAIPPGDNLRKDRPFTLYDERQDLAAVPEPSSFLVYLILGGTWLLLRPVA